MASKVGGGSTGIKKDLWSDRWSRQLRDMIPFGAVWNWFYVGVRCRNPAVGTTAEDIWGQGGVQVYPTTAATGTVVSTAAADDDGSTGALTVDIEGLDENYNEISETVTMNGTTGVTTSKSYLRVNSLKVATSGTGQTNAGDITITVGGNVQRFIAAGDGICHCSQYTIPAGHRAYLTKIEGTQGQDASTNFTIGYKTPASNTWIVVTHQIVYRNEVAHDMDGSIQIPEKSDVRMQGETASGSSDMAGYYVLFMEKYD